MDKKSTNTGKDTWVETGYRLAAQHGLDALKIDRIAKLLGKSRSGFYHCFGDMEGYEDALCDHHYERAVHLADALSETDHFYPDYVYLIADHKDYVFFHKQLYLQRLSNKKYDACFQRAKALTEPKTMELWKKSAQLEKNPTEQVRAFFEVIREVVFTKMDYETFTGESFNKTVLDVNKSFHFLLV